MEPLFAMKLCQGLQNRYESIPVNCAYDLSTGCHANVTWFDKKTLLSLNVVGSQKNISK